MSFCICNRVPELGATSSQAMNHRFNNELQRLLLDEGKGKMEAITIAVRSDWATKQEKVFDLLTEIVLVLRAAGRFPGCGRQLCAVKSTCATRSPTGRHASPSCQTCNPSSNGKKQFHRWLTRATSFNNINHIHQDRSGIAN